MSINKERQIDPEAKQQRRWTRHEAADSTRATLVHRFGEQVKITEEAPVVVTTEVPAIPPTEVAPVVAKFVQDELTGIAAIRAEVAAASSQEDMSYDLPQAA